MSEGKKYKGGEQNNQTKIERILPSGSIRRGIFYLSGFLIGLYFVGDQLLQERTSEVNLQIDQTGEELSTQLDEKLSPAAKTIDNFMKDYNQFRVDICLSPLGEQMEGCGDILKEYQEQKAKEFASEATTTTTTTTTITIKPN